MKNLFYDNFKPHKEFISLSKEFILSEGFTAKDIDNLVKEDFIEKISGESYRMTYNALRDFLGEYSYNWNKAWFGKSLFAN